MSIPDITLNSGTTIPQLGLGVWQATNDETEHAVRFALDEAGYRHIDTAAAYGNEEGVGRGIANSSVAREDIFLTTKLWNADQGYEPALKAFDTSIDKLGVDYVDLYLIHWPLQDNDRLLRTWDALEKIAESGRAKAIGVCNFEPHHLQLLVERGGLLPAVDQVELHPHLTQHAIRDKPPSTGSRSNRGAHSAVPVTQVGVRRPSPTPCSPTRSSHESVTATARLPRRS